MYFPLFISGSVKKKKQKLQSWNDGEFPGSPMIRILNFHYQESGFNPWLRNKNLKRENDDLVLGGVMVNCVCVCEMVNFMCQFDRLRDTQRADKTLLLGVSMRVFLEEVNI